MVTCSLNYGRFHRTPLLYIHIFFQPKQNRPTNIKGMVKNTGNTTEGWLAATKGSARGNDRRLQGHCSNLGEQSVARMGGRWLKTLAETIGRVPLDRRQQWCTQPMTVWLEGRWRDAENNSATAIEGRILGADDGGCRQQQWRMARLGGWWWCTSKVDGRSERPHQRRLCWWGTLFVMMQVSSKTSGAECKPNQKKIPRNQKPWDFSSFDTMVNSIQQEYEEKQGKSYTKMHNIRGKF